MGVYETGTAAVNPEQPLSELSDRAREATERIARVAELVRGDSRFGPLRVALPHPLVLRVEQEEHSVVVFPAEVWDRGRHLLEPFRNDVAQFTTRLVVLGVPEDPELERALKLGIGAILPVEPSVPELFVALLQAFDFMESRAHSEDRGRWVSRHRYELSELLEIARAITTEREIDALLGLILEKGRFITGADAGSVYVVEGTDPNITRRQLRFKLSQNDSIVFDPREFSMPISSRSLAGYVALEAKSISIADVYDMPAGSPYTFDRSFDDRIGYRTRSMLCVPLLSSKGEVLGVLQLINKKRVPQNKLQATRDFDKEVIPFDERSEQLLTTLAAQAGIALENAVLYEEIRGLFDGFVRASVDAIEARDPTTSGHSRRVSELTIGLAHAVQRETTGPYADVEWTREDLRELQYASLLHDFGKIGVREHVLVKAKKLYPEQLAAVRLRFDFVSKALEADILSRKLRAIERRATQTELEQLDRELMERRAELEAAWTTIETANEPTVLREGDFKKIEALGRETYHSLSGAPRPLLEQLEVASLSVPRGSLRAEEFDEIRSHVSHTYRFLSQIPWGKTFSRVPAIAGAHHERLNGTGYPNRLRAEEIPLQSKMMSISDIFDALTANDRPYKRAVPTDKALDILGLEVKDGHIDADLVRIFIEARIWEPVMGALY